MSSQNNPSLYRLVYTSLRKPECDDAEIQKILDACTRNNPGRAVTGVLLHSDRRFIQYIEGPLKDLEDLFDLIKNDPRHTAVNKRDFQPIDKRLFPSWEMGYKDITHKIGFHSNVSSTNKTKFDQIFDEEIDFTNKGMRLLQVFFDQESASV